MDLEFEIGDSIWAIVDCSIHHQSACPTCGQSVIHDIAFKQVDSGTIVGIDISLKKDQPGVFVYTCDFNGIIAANITQVWRTKEEADRVLDGIVATLEAL